ncbi:MAG: hypothetical protein BMS9Abin08_0711 [Gammaproteobacteria bacterium]|nr:MAG: hypothetical protein BMS9Abin08_0711 [Gammaproteobacteria bacterium]
MLSSGSGTQSGSLSHIRVLRDTGTSMCNVGFSLACSADGQAIKPEMVADLMQNDCKENNGVFPEKNSFIERI